MFSARRAYFAKGAMEATCSASWKKPMFCPVCSPAPPSSSIGQRFDQALAKAATAFSAPGPETASAAPMRPPR